MSKGITGTPQAGRDGLPLPVRGGIKARIKGCADRVRIIRATDARGKVRYKAAGKAGTATETEAAGQKLPDEKTRTASIVFLLFSLRTA